MVILYFLTKSSLGPSIRTSRCAPWVWRNDFGFPLARRGKAILEWGTWRKLENEAGKTGSIPRSGTCYFSSATNQRQPTLTNRTPHCSTKLQRSAPTFRTHRGGPRPTMCVSIPENTELSRDQKSLYKWKIWTNFAIIPYMRDFSFSLTIFAIIPYVKKYTFLELVFAIIPFSIQFRCVLLATAFVRLERTDKKEFLNTEILL